MQSLFHSRSRRPLAQAMGPLFAALCCLAFAVPGRAAGRQVLRGHVPAALSRLAPVGRLPGTRRLNLAITLPLRNQAALTDLLRQLYDPVNPLYRRYLSPAQFAARFGPAQQDYDAVAAFAKAHGLTVTNRYSNRVVLDVTGTVSEIESALHVTMRTYRHPTEARDFFAPDTEPALDLPVPILHIGGLDNYSLPRPRVHLMPAIGAAAARPNIGSGPGENYMGKDFRTAYVSNVTLTGSGQTVGLLQFDGYSSGDIKYYETLAGLPNVTLTNVLLDNYNGVPATTNGQLEVSLDIEMVISMARGVSKILVYEAGPDGLWEDILSRIATDNSAKQISCSWYDPGQPASTATDMLFEQMIAQGQSFFCASGDDDAYSGSIPFPEDSPYITEVGGTTLTVSGTGGPWSAETAWNWNNGTGTGGGVSTYYSIPYWQQGTRMTANGGSVTMRNTPDVALTADQVYVRAAGNDNAVGGTSCASPLWAGFIALVNQEAAANGRGNVGFLNPTVYALGDSSLYASVFHDIATGNNINAGSPNQFYALPGYDLCTGLGTPSGAGLINALALAPDNLRVSFASLITSGLVGQPFSPGSASFTLTNGGASPLAWSAGATQGWLSLSATAGTLAASGSTSVTASINAGVNALSTGAYADTVSFTDSATGYVQTRPVVLSATAAPYITSVLTGTATSGVGFTYQIAAANVPTTYAASGLPAGLGVNAATGLISGTTTATGTSSITITGSNAAGAGNALLSLLVRTPYAAWQSTMFSAAQLANPAISGDGASPAGDGIPNLLKYALYLNPFANGAGGLPAVSVAATGSGNYLTLTYTQVPLATDITYTVQVSRDLASWNSGPGYTTAPAAAPNAGGATESVTVQAVAPADGNTPEQFIRLQVSGP